MSFVKCPICNEIRNIKDKYTNSMRFCKSCASTKNIDLNKLVLEYLSGASLRKLANKYFLSNSTIRRLLKNKISLRNFKHKNIDLKELTLDYLSGMSLGKLSNKYVVDKGTIKSRLLENNISIRNRKDAAINMVKKKYDILKINSKQVIKLYNDDWCVTDLASKYKVSSQIVRNFLLRDNVKLRPKSETIKKAQQVYKELCKTEEFRIKKSAQRQGVSIEDWKGFSAKEDKLKMRTKEYGDWRKSIYKRDHYACKLCNKKGSSLQAHHILRRTDFPEFTLTMCNGITLCKECHKKTHFKEEQFTEKFFNLIK